jgi:hypothetical protein
MRDSRIQKSGVSLAVVVIAGLTMAACGSGSSAKSATPATSTTAVPGATAATSPPTTKAAGNPTGSDGSFKFTVTSQQCGQTTIGTDPLTTTAPSGTQWCVYGLNVANVKGSAQTFGASNQKAIDASNKQLSVDDTAVIYEPGGAASAFSTVNPGVSIDVQIPFQLATGDSIKTLVLHDSAFSGGVKVNVG